MSAGVNGKPELIDEAGKSELIDEAIRRFGLSFEEILMPVEIVKIYDAIQPDNELTLGHVEAALMQVTETPFCSKEELLDVLQDLDRRNFLLRGIKWEFAFLDQNRCGSLTLDDGYFLFSAFHGKNFHESWEKFLARRKNPESRLNFEELSLVLCKILDSGEDID